LKTKLSFVSTPILDRKISVSLMDPLGDDPWWEYGSNGASVQRTTMQHVRYQGDAHFSNRNSLLLRHRNDIDVWTYSEMVSDSETLSDDEYAAKYGYKADFDYTVETVDHYATTSWTSESGSTIEAILPYYTTHISLNLKGRSGYRNQPLGGSDLNSSSVYDQNLSEFNWLNLAAAEVTIWGGATSIAVSGSKPTYTGPRDWTKQVKAGTKFGRGLGALGLAITGYDMYSNGINTNNSLDATMGVVAFFGPIGAGISGAYFVGNLVTYGITGQTIGEHVDNYYWIPNPGGMGFIPVCKKPGR